jgi:pimeloyl-ACP methyl ester carboxylesterase
MPETSLAPLGRTPPAGPNSGPASAVYGTLTRQLVFLIHLAAVLDNWDPRIVDGIAAKHRVITFDYRGVGASSGSTPRTIEQMASDVVTFIRALGFDQVDLFGFSVGGRPFGVLVKNRNSLGSRRVSSPRAVSR